MAEHTPGPWKRRRRASRQAAFVVESADGKIIAAFAHGSKHVEYMAQIPLRVSAKNADLAAAAPALLQAMPTVPHPGGKLVKVVAHYEDGSTQTMDGEMVCAAIAKARGAELGAHR